MKYLFAALILSALAGPAFAEETPKQQCERIIAEAEEGPKQMVAAGNLYSRGGWPGVKCVKRDYVRAFELYAKAGARDSINGLLQDLEAKANQGMEYARIGLVKLQARGYIWVDVEQVR